MTGVILRSGVLRALVVLFIGVAIGAATTVAPSAAVAGASLLAFFVVAAPQIVLAIPIAEQLPVLLFAPAGSGQLVPVAVMVCAAAWYLRIRSAGSPPLLTHLTLGHWSLISVAVLSILNSLPLTGQALDFAVITGFISLPMLMIGTLLVNRVAPISWIIVPALMTLVVAVVQPERGVVNPLTVGNVGWISLVLLVIERDRLPRWLWLPLAVVSAFVWLDTSQLGPKIAGAVAITSALFHPRMRTVASGRTNGSLAGGRKILVYAFAAIVATFGGSAIGSALDESSAVEVNNTIVRQQAWSAVLSEASPLGYGISTVEVSAGRSTAEISPHNFILDAVQSAGWIGGFLMGLCVVLALRGFVMGSHRWLPYAIGILTMNLMSGGLFRSPSLWFAFGLLISSGARDGSPTFNSRSIQDSDVKRSVSQQSKHQS